MNSRERFKLVMGHMREVALLETTSALLEWDDHTGLPSQAGEFRADQFSYLSGLAHQKKTDPKLGEHLLELADCELTKSENTPEAAAIKRLLKDYQRNSRLPIDLVQAISKATALGQQRWELARKEDSWKQFAPVMEEVFSLRRQQAELLSDGASNYDVLLDEYEEGAEAQTLTPLFAKLRESLVTLVQELDSAPTPPSGTTWQRPVAIEKQRRVSHWIAEQIGFSFSRGRLDETSHPFCTTLGPDDCRILTRYQLDNFASGFYGTLHEAGHGLYEQGLPTDWFGLPPGMFASLGVHESQSRLWENFVGRSEAFWTWAFPSVHEIVGDAWAGIDAQQVYRDANTICPSLIRVEADEVTYNLHILIRFEIEQALLEQQLSVQDAPEAWNERYRHYLGIEPPSYRDGILQDVHWSAGLIGYFPTYTLGNLYAAQLMDAAEQELGNLSDQILKGSFGPLLDWLRQNIHHEGASVAPGELVRRVTGRELSAEPLVGYLRNKLSTIYGM